MKTVVAALVCLALMNVVVLPAAATPTGWGAEERLSVASHAWANDLEVDVGEGGEAIAAWDCYDNVSLRTSSWVALYDPERGWSGGSMLDSAAHSTYVQNVKINANGTAVAAWVRSSGGYVFPMAAVYEAGSGWRDAVMLSTDQATRIYSIDVSLNDRGQAVAAWDATIGNSYEVLASYYSPATGWGVESKLIHSDRVQADAMSGVDDQGGAMVVWREWVEVQGQQTVGLFRFSAYAAPAGWTTQSAVNGEDVSLGAPSAHMDMDGQGRALLAYGSPNATTNRDEVRATYYNGSLWLPPVVLSEEDGIESACPDVGLSRDGWGMVVWAQWNGSISEYQYRVFDAGAYGPLGTIPQAPSDSMNWPYIDVSDSRQVVATTKMRLDGESTEHAYAARYSPATGWSQWERLDKSSLTSIYFLVRGGVGGDGGAVVAWISYDDASNKARSVWTSSYAVAPDEVPGEVEAPVDVEGLRGQLTLATVAAVAAMVIAAISLVALFWRGRSR